MISVREPCRGKPVVYPGNDSEAGREGKRSGVVVNGEECGLKGSQMDYKQPSAYSISGNLPVWKVVTIPW